MNFLAIDLYRFNYDSEYLKYFQTETLNKKINFITAKKDKEKAKNVKNQKVSLKTKFTSSHSRFKINKRFSDQLI